MVAEGSLHDFDVLVNRSNGQSLSMVTRRGRGMAADAFSCGMLWLEGGDEGPSCPGRTVNDFASQMGRRKGYTQAERPGRGV